jgi:hypothetical protein
MRTTDHVLNTEPMDSHGVSISRFMKWAAERIAKEVEDNERIEAQAGTRDFIPGSRSTKKQDYTAIQAVKQCGIHNTTYYKWKRELNK